MAQPDKSRGDFYSGRLNERDVFGEFKMTDEARKAFRLAAEERGYITYNRVIELIRKFSSEDPTNPQKPFARELRMAVIEALGLEDDEDMDRIRFYSAVGTALDIYHGIDGWIELQLDEEPPILVTLDVTLNTKKTDHKADIIVQEITDPSQDEKRFVQDVEYYASQVIERFHDQLQRRGNSQSAA
ncbi:hypothetical protein HYV70_04805 [Candidatus Uhrbacteria bacterium]|nr:hypothetical protein [Candidatus Uhrbacteria bacterium]